MNKLAQLQLAKELLAQEYLQKQAALDQLLKQAVTWKLVDETLKGRLNKIMMENSPDKRSKLLSEAVGKWRDMLRKLTHSKPNKVHP